MVCLVVIICNIYLRCLFSQIGLRPLLAKNNFLDEVRQLCKCEINKTIVGPENREEIVTLSSPEKYTANSDKCFFLSKSVKLKEDPY